ncbi:hypothetical protein JRQ81_005310 [Phrynocephalus forsythii]|uniref:Uncharacterized protein n=1 Tax=Phrynocephalus forsythii TaxID=171643 RepID=A0A9Q1AVN7_9SAUR|nr:hypothetical protein JRQ81_005310 [Phrynocephalus forsythii]
MEEFQGKDISFTLYKDLVECLQMDCTCLMEGCRNSPVKVEAGTARAKEASRNAQRVLRERLRKQQTTTNVWMLSTMPSFNPCLQCSCWMHRKSLLEKEMASLGKPAGFNCAAPRDSLAVWRHWDRIQAEVAAGLSLHGVESTGGNGGPRRELRVSQLGWDNRRPLHSAWGRKSRRSLHPWGFPEAENKGCCHLQGFELDQLFQQVSSGELPNGF